LGRDFWNIIVALKLASKSTLVVLVGTAPLLIAAFLMLVRSRTPVVLRPIIDTTPDYVPPAAVNEAWTWRDAQGARRTRSQFNELLKGMKNSVEKSVSGMDLRGADLRGVNVLPLWFINTDLSEASLRAADLEYAVFRDAKLIKADLGYANLADTDLRRTDLTEADLTRADLSRAIYEPKVNPESWSIAASKGLSSVRWIDNSRPIFVLRKSFIDEGFREAARELTVAIHRHNQSTLEKVLFDWTCEWGTNWVRPLGLVGLLSLICTIIYRLGIQFGKRSSLYLATSGRRVKTDKAKERIFRISISSPDPTPPAKQQNHVKIRSSRFVSFRRAFKRQRRALGAAFLFSLMSVFNIGFREFNFGRWIRMAQPREFDIRARGWMRTVSGIQSLLGVALTALSLLSYFGRPFD